MGAPRKLPPTCLLHGLCQFIQTPDGWMPFSQNGRSFASVSQGRGEREEIGLTGRSENTAQSSVRVPEQAWFCLAGALDALGTVSRAVSHSESGNGKCCCLLLGFACNNCFGRGSGSPVLPSLLSRWCFIVSRYGYSNKRIAGNSRSVGVPWIACAFSHQHLKYHSYFPRNIRERDFLTWEV